MMKAKAKGSNLKLGSPSLILFCSLFFFLGLFLSTILFQQDLGDARPRSGARILEESVAKKDYDPLEHGKTGEDFVESIPFQVLSWRPRAVYFPNFTSAELCDRIIDMAKSKLQPSKLALRKGESAESTKGTRTSSGTFISASEDKTGILELIERKIARVTMLPRTHGEAFNILRYEIGQKYDAHYDAFNPAEYGPQQSQRDGMNIGRRYDYKECIGLKVKPRQGDGLLFYSLLPNGTIDKTSLHGSCPVIEGQKWVATKWIRDRDRV
ncbi:probable prolyl 4-hydroxylase 9 isoform X3 [Neltuma alba]|uniref:probable prolyl 4-hydroxylase 9 isoform X3 n=1 Tax=Neltuma alba TaxID=207710 RepID=UPI0010A392A6|nr:probable prolyl 4-hydroxylase 9 isoform X3 [Prosopis alba]